MRIAGNIGRFWLFARMQIEPAADDFLGQVRCLCRRSRAIREIFVAILPALPYFSLRQFNEPRVSTVLDSISASKPLRNRYFSVIAEPPPTIDTP